MANSDRPETKKRRGNASSGEALPAGEDSAPREAPAPLVKRDASGRLVAGGPSLNPGGRHKADKELAELLQSYLGTAVQRAVEMLDDPDPRVQEIGLKFVERHALGKRALVDVLALAGPDAPKPDASTAAIQDSLRGGLAQHAQQYGARVASGLATPEEARTASEMAHTLVMIAKEERLQEAADEVAKMPPDQLRGRALAVLSTEDLKAELAARMAVPTEGEAKS